MDRGHRRLRLEGSEGVDHTNPASWTGNVIVKNVSLLTTWNVGRTEAINILKTAGVADVAQAFAFTEDKPGIDMLRPEGTYVGLRESEVDVAAHIISEASDAAVKISAMERDSMTPVVELNEPMPEVDNLDLEDVIPDNPGEDADGLFAKDNLWVDISGHQVHKASAIRLMLGSDEGLKSTERLLRVRGYMRHGTKRSINEDSIAGELFMVGQLAATFLRVDDQAALCIIKVTAIIKGKETNISCIPLSDLADHKITLRGQVLSLKPHGTA
ncbi:hypothetical protein EWM64_g1118 [Hericium alpestre]|uniref:Uncharacterized protein n=1 Tax=Hericium alpestre TaxID=135208 RepID=A0A4Z0A828_9AGAM|nr:hypothetical protein EWM64_g1118 [Hericium alpestre]